MIISDARDEPLISSAVSLQVEKRGRQRTMALLWWHVSPATPRRPTPATPRPCTPLASLTAACRVHVLAWVSPVAACKGRRSLCFGFIGFGLIWGQCKNGIITGIYISLSGCGLCRQGNKKWTRQQLPAGTPGVVQHVRCYDDSVLPRAVGRTSRCQLVLPRESRRTIFQRC